MFQSGGAPYTPEAHGRRVAPAAGMEGGLAGGATRRVEARVGRGVGKRACSRTEVGLVTSAVHAASSNDLMLHSTEES